MATSYRKQAILANAQSEIGGNSFTHDSVLVTVTATMGNGSMLVAANTEGAVADAATVVKIIDDPKFDDGLYEVGSVELVRVATNNVIANSDVIKFSDAAFGGEALTALVAAGVKLQSADTDFTRN